MISFTLPWALLGLALAGIPLFLHLVQRHEPRELVFPAVRYLEDATRDHRRRFRFRNLLLLILRTLLILALVLAAAGATIDRGGLGSHAPSALVLVVDNSASSATVHDGVPVLASLMTAANAVLDRATLADRLWLLTADGNATPGTPSELRSRLTSLQSAPLRLDLGRAVTSARELLRASGRPGQVVVLTDAQQSALGPAPGDAAVLVLRPAGSTPANHAVVELGTSPQPWGPEGGRVTILVTASDTTPLPVTLSVGARRLRDVLVTPGIPSLQHIASLPAGWNSITATLPPDESRWDDSRTVAVRVAPGAMVQWDGTDRFVAAAMAVLASDGRVRPGNGIHLGTLAAGPSVVVPPADLAQVGAINRSLASRGVAWRFGTLVVANARTDSNGYLPAREAVAQRLSLEQQGTGGEVLATVAGAPWLVRSGDILLVGSRFDPAWSALPFSANFVPFLDAILTRAMHGEPSSPDAAVGEPFQLPVGITAVSHDGDRQPIEPGTRWTPARTGMHLLLAGADTIGALSAHVDVRESALTRASDATVQSLWSHVTITDPEHGARRAFAFSGRGDLRGPLLALALCCALIETGLVGMSRTRTA